MLLTLLSKLLPIMQNTLSLPYTNKMKDFGKVDGGRQKNLNALTIFALVWVFGYML